MTMLKETGSVSREAGSGSHIKPMSATRNLIWIQSVRVCFWEPAKTLFLNKVLFWGSGWMWILGGHFLAYHRDLNVLMKSSFQPWLEQPHQENTAHKKCLFFPTTLEQDCQPELTVSPRGHVAMSGDTLDCHNWGSCWALVSSTHRWQIPSLSEGPKKLPAQQMEMCVMYTCVQGTSGRQGKGTQRCCQTDPRRCRVLANRGSTFQDEKWPETQPWGQKFPRALSGQGPSMAAEIQCEAVGQGQAQEGCAMWQPFLGYH